MKKTGETKKRTKRKCPHCRKMHDVDPRVARTQQYCGKEACQAESKRVSQARWTAKNPGYFTDASSTLRSRACRERKKTQQVSSTPKPVSKPELHRSLTIDREEDTDISNLVATEMMQQEMIKLFSTSEPLIMGLLCILTGSVQQDEIDSARQKVLSLGQEVLGLSP